jgi:hypothetical protein
MLLRLEWTENPYFEEFVRGVHERNLRYYASDIQQILGLMAFEQLEEPIRRAMQVCRSEGLQADDHFKPVYRCKESNTLRDWKLSTLGYCLVMLNCNPVHPTVARMQMALVRKGVEGLRV